MQASRCNVVRKVSASRAVGIRNMRVIRLFSTTQPVFSSAAPRPAVHMQSAQRDLRMPAYRLAHPCSKLQVYPGAASPEHYESNPDDDRLNAEAMLEGVLCSTVDGQMISQKCRTQNCWSVPGFMRSYRTQNVTVRTGIKEREAHHSCEVQFRRAGTSAIEELEGGKVCLP